MGSPGVVGGKAGDPAGSQGCGVAQGLGCYGGKKALVGGFRGEAWGDAADGEPFGEQGEVEVHIRARWGAEGSPKSDRCPKSPGPCAGWGAMIWGPPAP